MSFLLDREPALTLAAVQATLSLGLAFGAPLSTEQIGALLAFSAATLGWLLRRRVTPVKP